MPALLSVNARTLLGLKAAAVLAVGPSFAQNTSSVSGPAVSAGEREIEYRFGWIPENDGASDRFRHRVDYGQSLGERTAFKLFANVSNRPGEALSLDNINAEYKIELTPEASDVWQSAVRLDVRLTDGTAPERAGLNWLNQWQLTETVRARGQLIATRQFGSNAASDVSFELRTSLIWDLRDGYSLSLLSFQPLGTHRNFGLSTSEKQLGPTLSGPLPNGLRWTAGTLFGLSDEAPSHDLRFWLSKDF